MKVTIKVVGIQTGTTPTSVKGQKSELISRIKCNLTDKQQRVATVNWTVTLTNGLWKNNMGFS